MRIKNLFRRSNETRPDPVAIWLKGGEICCPGYTTLDKNPEVMTACRRIAELIGTLTIHLMANTENGDVRIINELSRRIDIEPMQNMTRSTWMTAIVLNLLLYGNGNSIVRPRTRDGMLMDMEPISASRVELNPVGNSYRRYTVSIDGIERSPTSLLHFVLNPDETYPWKGKGITVTLRDIAKNLSQAQETENAFMRSEWKPSIIVKVDGLTEEFSSPEGREKLLASYAKPAQTGQPWLIPAEQFSVEQVRPLSLTDLAIADTVELDKRTVAAVVGVPPFLLGVGGYNAAEWNGFVQHTIRPIALEIQQELTRKLITSPSWYLKFNTLSLMDWDLNTIYSVFGGLTDKGIVTGNEVRDRLGMSPIEGLDELRILENFIPADMIGDQKKLNGGTNE